MADAVNHPAHYNSERFGIECIEFTRHMNFSAGNAFKYIWRHAEKNGLEDLRKALVYLLWAQEDDVDSIVIGRRVHMLMASGLYLVPKAEGVYLALNRIVNGDYLEAIEYVEAEIARSLSGAA